MASGSTHIPSTITERAIHSGGNYWVAMVGDLIRALVLCVFGIRHRSSSLAVRRRLYCGGFIAWSLLEYVLHRWVLHGRRLSLRGAMRGITSIMPRLSVCRR